LEAVAHPGLAIVTKVPQTVGGESLESHPGSTLEEFSAKLIGRMTQHATRKTRWWSMTTKNDGGNVGGLDYDFTKPLIMHTDNSHYVEPNFMMYFHQPIGDTYAKVSDGLAISEELRRLDPETWEFCVQVPLVHGLRHRLYSKEGSMRDVTGPPSSAAEYELHAMAPLIELHHDKTFYRIRHSESKRSIVELPYEDIERFYKAYTIFSQLCEEERFCYQYRWSQGEILLINNFRCLHGRATLNSPERLLVGGYHLREQVAHRHRLLQMSLAAQRTGLDEKWLFRLPNTAICDLLNQGSSRC